MKRPLLVFAGQSNMMGASVYPASKQLYFKNSFEYLHKSKRFVSPPSSEFSLCRDSFYGFTNQHVNEKGFKVIAKYAVPNLIRVLFENKEPVLEEELISALI